MMEFRLPKKNYPLNHKDYILYEEVGQGMSAIVYRALCIPLDHIVAIKVIDLEKCNNDMDMIRREVQTMILLDHPNLLKARCSFMATRSLWIVMPYMAAGSCLHIMKSAHPDGFEEHTIVTLLYGVLKALAYLHSHGHIHRDVKAGNILVSSKGAVKLADFGVTTSLFESGNRLHSRKTFVGTPCWMAPEVMQQLHGYDFKADIWSFGITALELAHGHAPFSKYPPMKVLLMTLQNAPPGLDYERDKRFSKSFKEIVAACLVKDQKKRPTAEKLLKHRFFKNARSREFIVRTILDGLSPLGDRFRIWKQKEAEMFGQNGEEHLSQQEYIKGISAWKFDVEDLKRQALLIQDDDGITLAETQGWICKDKSRTDVSVGQLKRSIPNGVTRSHVEESVDSINGPAACVVPALHHILQQNVMQMVQITRSIENFHQITVNQTESPKAAKQIQLLQLSSASAREKILEAHVNFIEIRIKKLDEELQIQKSKNAKLERLLSQIDKEASLSHRRN